MLTGLLRGALLAPLLGGLLCSGLTTEALAQDGQVIAIKAGKIVTMDSKDRVLNNAVLLIKKGKIVALGSASEVAIPAGAKVVDASNRWLVPGLIDCHNHTAGSLRDLNDGIYLTNPGLRTVDTLNPDTAYMRNAMAGGVTSVLLIPGSGNNMSGFGTVASTGGRTAQEMIRRAPGSLKIAQAGNPERYWFGVGRSYMNYNLRQTLEKAQKYHKAWNSWEAKVKKVGQRKAGDAPAYDPIWHDFRGLFQKKFPVSVHTQMYQVVHKTIVMLHDRFKLKVVLDHSTFDGFKTAPLIVERDIYTIVGPRQYFFDRTSRRIYGCAQKYYEAGVRKLGINTDAPVVPQQELTLQATIGSRLGLDGYVALKALTIVPAGALGIEKQVGSLEVGKDADLGVWTGDPIDPRKACLQTWVRGRLAYDSKKKRRF